MDEQAPIHSHKKERGYQVIILLLLVLLVSMIGYMFLGTKNSATQPSPNPQSSEPPQAYDSDAEKYTWDISVLSTGLEVPWDLALTEDGRIFVTERPGKLKLVETNGNYQTVATLANVASVGESGLTGLALHPDFKTNGFIYLYYTYRDSGNILNRVSRFTFRNNTLSAEQIILDALPGGSIHNGGRLRFGPDKKLWVLTGDAARPALAQDINSLAGKVLRLNDDGSVPADNPVEGSLVYSTGHRNPQGIDFHPLSEEILVSSHGETAYDEINLVKANGNYGWPDIKKCFSDDPRFINPIFCTKEETLAPSGLAFMGNSIWRFRYSLIFAGLRGNILQRLGIVDGKVAEEEVIIKNTYGRLRGVIVDQKTGIIYVSTSNRDGRGQVQQGDDKILKITPKKVE